MTNRLIFRWCSDRGLLIRLVTSLFVSLAIFVFLFSSVEIFVPSNIAPDGPLRRPARLLVMTDSNQEAWSSLLNDESLPTLGQIERGSEFSSVDEILDRLGLAENDERKPKFYPAPELPISLETEGAEVPVITFPTLEKLPLLRRPVQTKGEKVVELVAEGQLEKLLPTKTFNWEGEFPLDRSLLFQLGIAEDGSTSFVIFLPERRGEQGKALRQIVERWVVASEIGPLDSGRVGEAVATFKFLAE